MTSNWYITTIIMTQYSWTGWVDRSVSESTVSDTKYCTVFGDTRQRLRHNKKAVLSQRCPRNALYTGALKIFSSSSSPSPDPNHDRIPKLNLDASRLQM